MRLLARLRALREAGRALRTPPPPRQVDAFDRTAVPNLRVGDPPIVRAWRPPGRLGAVVPRSRQRGGGRR